MRIRIVKEKRVDLENKEKDQEAGVENIMVVEAVRVEAEIDIEVEVMIGKNIKKIKRRKIRKNIKEVRSLSKKKIKERCKLD